MIIGPALNLNEHPLDRKTQTVLCVTHYVVNDVELMRMMNEIVTPS